jgi:sugar/nucleoside kinase (ribokinase family)
MYDLISIGTVGIDLYFQGASLTHSKDRFELAIGGKYFTDYFHESLGGGATNIAIGVQREGGKVALMAKVGNNSFKKIILERLERYGIAYKDFCQFADDYYNISSIFLTPKGEKTIVNYRSPHQHFMRYEDDYEQLTKAKAIYIANLPNVSIFERTKILQFAQQHTIKTIMNLGVVDCRRKKTELDSLLKHIDILMINGYEFADLVKAQYKDIDFREDVIKHYIPGLKYHIVVVTDGVKGSNAYHEGKVYHQKALRPHTILDTTGAGDGYTAGFIAEYIKTKNIAHSMLNGAKYAAYILGKIGAN